VQIDRPPNGKYFKQILANIKNWINICLKFSGILKAALLYGLFVLKPLNEVNKQRQTIMTNFNTN